jgi:TorA maturation chaperone TorD
MPLKSEPEQRIAVPVQRAAVYEFLARCFAYPTEESLEDLREIAHEAATFLTDPGTARLAGIARTADRAMMEQGYIGTFTAVTSPDCPTFESAYVCTDGAQQTAVMADVAGFYRTFGVDAAEAGFRPDDLCLELSFMGFLCQKEAYAGEHLGAPRTLQARRAQRLFLREHLGRWAEVFAVAVERNSGSAFYQQAGQTLRDWIACEIRHTGAEPIHRAGGPAMPWPKPERGAGFDIGGPSGLVSLEDIIVEGEP